MDRADRQPARRTGRVRCLAPLLCLSLAAACAKPPDAWVEDLHHPEPFVRDLAAAALGRTSPETAAPAFRALLDVLDDDSPGVRKRVAGTLDALARRHLPLWLEGESLDFLVADRARPAVDRALHTHADVARTALVERIRTPDGGAPAAAAALLARLDVAPLPELRELLAHPDALVRARAAFALGILGPRAGTAQDTLSSLTIDSEPGVRRASLEALAAVAEAPETLPEMEAALADPDEEVRTVALRVFARARLDELLNAPIDERAACVEELRALGGPGIDVLIEALESRGRRALRRVFFALVELADRAPRREDPEETVKDLDHADAARRARAAYDLARLGTRAAPARNRLVRALADPSLSVRACAAFALGRLGPSPRTLRPELELLLRDPEPLVREVASYTLALLE